MNIFEELRGGVVASSAEEMRELGARVGREVPSNTTLALHGNLGVGKTTWVHGLASGLGIHERTTSPTFNIFTLHRGTRMNLLHLDAYRLDSAAQLEALMLEDFLITPFCAAIEWPEKIATWLPPDTWHFDLSIVVPGQHRIQLRSAPAPNLPHTGR